MTGHFTEQMVTHLDCFKIYRLINVNNMHVLCTHCKWFYLFILWFQKWKIHIQSNVMLLIIVLGEV